MLMMAGEKVGETIEGGGRSKQVWGNGGVEQLPDCLYDTRRHQPISHSFHNSPLSVVVRRIIEAHNIRS